jgi:carbamoyl-phosphate synthase small subunit
VTRPGYLALADGTVWHGEAVGADGYALGEAVFTTGMSGYQEAVTDPSFEDQLVCFTAPMIGNYGVRDTRSESERTHARAVLMREARGPEWTAWLHERGVVALTGIDTRSLVLHLRDVGSALGIAVASDLPVEEAVELAARQPPMLGRALVATVSTKEPYVYAPEGRVRIGVVDYGVKRSVLQRLAAARAAVTVYPHDADSDELAGNDGVLLSPGPGDPEPLEAETATVRDLLGRTHVLGICLGHQLIARATGLETYKLPFGHRGANHPVLERRTGRVLVTSQNHGFAVGPSAAVEASHVSLYDGTVEGLDLPELQARSLQFHPEAGPGPHDGWPLLEGWVEDVAEAVAA